MSQDLIIAGAGGMAREVRELIESTGLYHIIGFVAPGDAGTTIDGLPVLGDDSFLLEYQQDLNVVIALGDGAERSRLYQLYRSNPRLAFPSVISPGAHISPSASYGLGCIIAHSAVISTDARLGAFCFLSFNATVGHDCVLADFVSLNPGAHLSGNVTVGRCAMFGSGCAVRQGLHIGTHATVGMASSVIRDVEDDTSVIGVPAQPFFRRKKRSSETQAATAPYPAQ
ncbi:MAG: acetyltransferase [Succinivibrio sp.]|nr:acetyltransferase [Succinivibrio sp.]